jgi:hypothetical protein
MDSRISKTMYIGWGNGVKSGVLAANPVVRIRIARRLWEIQEIATNSTPYA